MTASERAVVFLVDVDNTLLDNDRVIADLQVRTARELGGASSARYWEIFEELRRRLGYADYLGALQQYRLEHPTDARLAALAFFLLDYPFASRLYPRVHEALAALRAIGPTVILSDGDVVFQPRKVERSGIAAAVGGRVLIYIHKERALDDVERRFPARHYVLVDDKPRILAAVKRAWGGRVTTVLPRQGQYAHDARALAAGPAPDFAIERIGDLLAHDLPALGIAGDQLKEPR
jgi:FMN phosphatase YigB (HAD superfamily)